MQVYTQWKTYQRKPSKVKQLRVNPLLSPNHIFSHWCCRKLLSTFPGHFFINQFSLHWTCTLSKAQVHKPGDVLNEMARTSLKRSFLGKWIYLFCSAFCMYIWMYICTFVCVLLYSRIQSTKTSFMLTRFSSSLVDTYCIEGMHIIYFCTYCILHIRWGAGNYKLESYTGISVESWTNYILMKSKY